MGEIIRGGHSAALLEGRVYVHEVTLSEGSATLTFTDVEGIDGALEAEPYVFVTGPSGGESVSSKGAAQCTVEGSGSDDVECLIVVPYA